MNNVSTPSVSIIC